jgi:hypothetical protein
MILCHQAPESSLLAGKRVTYYGVCSPLQNHVLSMLGIVTILIFASQQLQTNSTYVVVTLAWWFAGKVPDSDIENVCNMIVNGQRSFPVDATTSSGKTQSYTFDVSVGYECNTVTYAMQLHVVTAPHVATVSLGVHMRHLTIMFA